MTIDANLSLMRRWYELMSQGVPAEALVELLAPDHVNHARPPGVPDGIEGFRMMHEGFRAAFPDLRIEPLQTLASGDLVAVHARVTGTNTGPFMGGPATGRAVTFTGTEIVRIRDGRIAERWGNWDEVGILRGLGHLPGPA